MCEQFPGLKQYMTQCKPGSAPAGSHVSGACRTLPKSQAGGTWYWLPFGGAWDSSTGARLCLMPMGPPHSEKSQGNAWAWKMLTHLSAQRGSEEMKPDSHSL